MKLTKIASAKKVIVNVKRRGYQTQSIIGVVRQIAKTANGQSFVMVEIGKDKLVRAFPQDVKEYKNGSDA